MERVVWLETVYIVCDICSSALFCVRDCAKTCREGALRQLSFTLRMRSVEIEHDMNRGKLLLYGSERFE